MPHIIVEYSHTLEHKVPALLSDLHEQLAGLGVDMARIKTRGISIDHAQVGSEGAGGAMAHCTLLLLKGRDLETKKKYGQALHDLMRAELPPRAAVTLEIREMDNDTYFL